MLRVLCSSDDEDTPNPGVAPLMGVPALRHKMEEALAWEHRILTVSEAFTTTSSAGVSVNWPTAPVSQGNMMIGLALGGHVFVFCLYETNFAC